MPVKTKKKNETTLRGTVSHLYYASDRFTAGRVKTNDKDEVSFTGKFGGIRENDAVILRGCFIVHDKYGEQFSASGFEYDTDFSIEGIANYIASNPEIKGIGIARAVKIAEFCGDDFDIIVSNEPERLTSLPGITQEIAASLHSEWCKHKELNKCMTGLAVFDLTHKQILSLMKKYGNNAVRVIKENPYRLIEDIRGYGFKKADIIARKAGTSKTSPYRIRSCLIFILENALQDGDCYLEYRDLVTRANKVLVLDSLDSRQIIESQLDALIQTSERVINIPYENQLFVSIRAIYEMEHYIGKVLAEHNLENNKLDASHALESITGSLNEDQKEAVLIAINNAFCLISGGAGTGKTYTVSCIVDLYLAADLSITLCAPTGKAAKRMEQATGFEASTIHRLLGYDGTGFSRGPEDPIETDVLIIDEVSMLDVPLCWHLFRALDFKKTNLVLVGDHNQLPPVGPGNILRDIIQQKIIPMTILNKVVRQAGILKENSLAVLSGRVPPNADRSDLVKEWYVVDKFKDPEDVLRFILYLYENVLQEKLGLDLVRDIQLLAPMKKGVLGVDAVNIHLQRLIQNKCFRNDIPPVQKNRRPKLHVNDKIIQNRNDYGLDVMNGSVGYIKRYLPDDGGTYHIEFDDGVRVVEVEAMKNISLAYASTVHKMQGSECECVIVVMHKSQSFMHHRNLFYTAVTRAKKAAIIIGDRWGIRNCAEKEFTEKRKTFLSLDNFLETDSYG